MANGIRTGDTRRFNKGRSSKFREGSRVRQIPEEGRRTYRPKRCGNNNKDEDNSPKTLNDKDSHPALSAGLHASLKCQIILISLPFFISTGLELGYLNLYLLPYKVVLR